MSACCLISRVPSVEIDAEFRLSPKTRNRIQVIFSVRTACVVLAISTKSYRRYLRLIVVCLRIFICVFPVCNKHVAAPFKFVSILCRVGASTSQRSVLHISIDIAAKRIICRSCPVQASETCQTAFCPQRQKKSRLL